MRKQMANRMSPINRANKELSITRESKEEQRGHDIDALAQVKREEKKYKGKVIKIKIEKSILMGTENYLRYILSERGYNSQEIDKLIKDGHK